MRKFRNFFKDESGATMVEYGLMLALIAVVVVSAVQLVGQSTSGVFNAADSSLTGS